MDTLKKLYKNIRKKKKREIPSCNKVKKPPTIKNSHLRKDDEDHCRSICVGRSGDTAGCVSACNGRVTGVKDDYSKICEWNNASTAYENEKNADRAKAEKERKAEKESKKALKKKPRKKKKQQNQYRTNVIHVDPKVLGFTPEPTIELEDEYEEVDHCNSNDEDYDPDYRCFNLPTMPPRVPQLPPSNRKTYRRQNANRKKAKRYTSEPIPDYIMRALKPKKSVHPEYGKLRY